MPRKARKRTGAAAQGPSNPHGRPTTPDPSTTPERSREAAAEALEVPVPTASAATEALEGLDIATAAADDLLEPPPPEPDVPPPPPQPPLGASSSGRSAAGWSREEAARRLEELLGARGQEVELTEVEVRTNDQRQEDEIMALEAIFGDNVVVFDKKETLRSFQVHVCIELPDGVDVSAKLCYASGALKCGATCDNDVSGDLVYKFRVEHLPPILLTCLLPLSYPSHHPPFFTISTEWLDKVMISSLCHMLDTIWAEQQGQEVTFQWVQWLQSSSLSHFGFENEIVLSKVDIRCDEDCGDKRALSNNAAPDVIIPRMMKYNGHKCHEAFLHAIHDCMICFNELAGVDFIQLPCHHFFCWKCMRTYSKMHVKEGTVVKLLCPDTKCGGVVPPNILKRLLGEDEFERWEKLLLQRTLDSMSDVVYCPRCETACLEDVDNDAVCPTCLFSFCTLCRERRHVGEECMSPADKLHILEGRQKSGQVQAAQQKILNELRSLREVLRDAKQCPRCGMAISKKDGCNKMSCWSCGQYFCYQCNQAINGYDHFRGSCVLFPQEEIDRWDMQMNQRVPPQVVAQAPAAMYEEYGHLCPTCRQLSPKIGNNNHIFCWACQKHFCALCRKTVTKTSQHYGPKGCKQHTVDP